MNMISICGIAFVVAIFSVILKKYNKEYSIILSIISGIIIISIIISKINPVFNEINSLIKNTGIASEYSPILFKTLGICFLTQFTSDCCKDAEEQALAFKVEISGKLAILLISLPLFEKILEIASKLIRS